MVTTVYLYIGLGVILVLQAVLRGWKYRPLKGLEDYSAAMGAVFLWPLILSWELREIYRNRKKN